MIVVAAIVVAVLIAAAAAVVVTLRRYLPRSRGLLVVSGLHDPVTVVRDRFGVAHVDAASMEDAAFAMGAVHAQERLWQLDLSRRAASGRISEIAGSQGLDADRFLRRVGLRRVAQTEADLLDGEARTMLEAYAAGVNSVIEGGGRLPVEFALLRIRPEPWRPVDSIACAKLLALGLSLNWDREVQRMRLLRAVGPEVAARLEVTYPDTNPTVLAETVRAVPHLGDEVLRMYRQAARWLPSPVGASNAWAVAGSRTAAGRPLLCNDPHLQPSVPSVWFAAHVRAGDDFETTGVTLPGQPFPLLGHNRRIAWGFTNSFADCQDLVVEQFDSPAGTRHRTEKGWRPSQIAREVIRVKGHPDEVEEVVITRHGPVVERCDDATTGRWLGLALQWTALAPACAAQSVLDLQRAGDWHTFRRAFAGLDAPSQNAVYADVDGHIGYFCNGRIPVRKRRPSGLPEPGWEGGMLWQRYLTVDEAPQALDPPDGLVITANNRIVGEDFPHYIANDYMAGYRARRLRELLERDRSLTPADMMAAQLDVVAPPAVQVAAALAGVRCAGELAEAMRAKLAAWDGRMAPSLIEPTVYEAFMLRLAEHVLRPLCGDAWGIAAGVDLTHPVLGYPGNLAGGGTPLVVERWAAGDDSLFDGRTTWDEVAARALEDAVADLTTTLGRPRRWRWGRVHRLPLQHPLAVRRVLRPLLNAPALTVGGGVDTVMATGQQPGNGFATTVFAPSWRQVFDVGNWAGGCTAILYPGQSGHRASRHHHDLSKRWVRNRQFTLAWGDAAFRGRRRLVLVPGERGLIARPGL